MNQIRLNKTPQIEKVLSFLKNKYQILSEAEIIKIALSEKYEKEALFADQNQEPEKKQDQEKQIKEAWERIKVEGKKIGDRMLAEKGLKREDVTEQQFYDLFLDDHKHKD